MRKQAATLSEQWSDQYVQIMQRINEVALRGGLQKYDTYCRIWEYPWIWFQVESLRGGNLSVLDIGSEKSPLPWFLATQGFKMIVSDNTGKHWQTWQRASHNLQVKVRKRILDAQAIDLPTASIDIFLSVSVIEHIPHKEQVIAEAARVLRPGGLLIMTFDICEPEMGMSFPKWNGRALSMADFDCLFRNSSWFEPRLADLPWNVDSIPSYLEWNRTTAPHHNYIAGAAVVNRNALIWSEPQSIALTRIVRSITCAYYHQLSHTSRIQLHRWLEHPPILDVAHDMWRRLRK